MTAPEMSGVDLARFALRNAREAAKNAPAPTRRKTTKRRRAERGDGRDPMALGAAITRLIDERAWEAPAAGGSIIDQWPTIAPELVGKVAAERFNADTGTLYLRPVSPAYATQLRMFGRQIADQVNAKVPGANVRAIHVLAPGAIPQPEAEAQEAAAQQATPPEPRTRDQASPGYHRALEAHTAARCALERDDPTRESRDRLFGSIRDTLREPEEAFTDGQAALEDAQPPDDAEAIRARAIARARAEKAGRTPAIPRLLDTA